MTQIGGYLPNFRFRLNATSDDPRTFSAGSTGISTGQFIDANRIATNYSGWIRGTQYKIQIINERPILNGVTSDVFLKSSNTGLAQIDQAGNVTYQDAGNFRIIGIYTGNSYYLGREVSLNLSNVLTTGSVDTTGTIYSFSGDVVNVSKHVLVVFNSGSRDSIDCKTYYTGQRPQFSSANTLGLNCWTGESVNYNHFITGIRTPIVNYLTGVSGSKPIRYIVMMKDIPTRVSDTNIFSVSYQLMKSFNELNLRQGNEYSLSDKRFSLGEFQGTTALINYINLGTLADCSGYINKISAGQTGIYLTGGGNNTGYYIEDHGQTYSGTFPNFCSGRYLRPLLSEFPSVKYVYRGINSSYITTGDNLLGFCTWGINGGRAGNYANDGSIKWGGDRNWYIMTSIESFNGQRIIGQGNFIDWFSSGAFGGTGWENCPVGASCHVEEPYLPGVIQTGFYLYWNRGWSFAEAAWANRSTKYNLVIGDPLTVK